MDEIDSEQISDGQGVGVHRIPIEYSGYFAVQEPLAESDTPPALIVATHGYGQSCRSFIRNFAPLLDSNVLIVAPQAINHFYWERGKVGFAWVTRFMRDETLAHTMAYLKDVMTAVRDQYAFDESRVFLVGFSNGATMAFRLAASDLMQTAGVVACSGDLPDDVEKQLPKLDKFPVLLMHGKNDDTVKVDKTHDAEAALKKNEFDVDKVLFEGGHDLSPMHWEHVFEWLGARVAAMESNT